MVLHPFSKFILALDIVTVILVLPPVYGSVTAAVMLAALAFVSTRTDTKLTGPFIKLFVFGSAFLFLIHAVTWRPFGISPEGIDTMLTAIARIGAVVAAVLYLSGQIKGNELYVLMIDMHVPPPAILILFRTLWLVPRFMERIDEVILAQRLRGMRLKSYRDRARAVLPALTPVFASMLEETYTHAMTMTIRGFLEPCRKTHQLELQFRLQDGVIVILGVTVMVMLVLAEVRWF